MNRAEELEEQIRKLMEEKKKSLPWDVLVRQGLVNDYVRRACIVELERLGYTVSSPTQENS